MCATGDLSSLILPRSFRSLWALQGFPGLCFSFRWPFSGPWVPGRSLTFHVRHLGARVQKNKMEPTNPDANTYTKPTPKPFFPKKTSAELYLTSSHLHLHIVSSTSSPLHIHILTCISAHLHIYIFATVHLHLCSSSHPHIYISHLYLTSTSHICTSHLHLTSSPLALLNFLS